MSVCPKLTVALRYVLACVLLCTGLTGFGQKKIEIDGDATAYVTIHSRKEVGGLGIVSLYTQKNFCQLRYNYEDNRTFSFLWGRPLTKQTKKAYVQVVPTIGLSAGNFMGVSPGIQVYAEYKNMEFSNSSQTSICVTNLNRSFFFTWSEALYKVKNIWKVGLSVQYLKQYPTMVRNKELGITSPPQQQLDLGMVTGVEYWRFYLCGYVFNAWDAHRHYAVSLTYNFR
jgi:hypothetical protein